MLEIGKILCPTDFTAPAAAALAEAVRLARRFTAELHLFHAVTLVGDLHGPPEGEGQSEPGGGHSTQRALKKLAGRLEGEGISVHQAQWRGLAPGPTICEYAEEKRVDLIVLGTHGRRGLRRLLLGSVAEEVLHGASCPVMTVRPGNGAPRPTMEPAPLERILVPIDFSDYSEVALAYARELAAAFGARLALLHVVPFLPVPRLYGSRHGGSPSEREPGLEERLAGVLERWMEGSAGPRVPFEVRVVEGRAASQIIQGAAEGGSDLIVMASHGLTGLRHLALGSTAEEVVRNASCPVFVIKSFGRSLLQD